MAFVILEPTYRENQIIQEYVAQWKFNCINERIIRTKTFSPIPFIDAKFCFEILFQKIDYHYILKVMLVKLNSSGIPPHLKLKFDVNVRYGGEDEEFLKKFSSESPVVVNDITRITCINMMKDDHLFSDFQIADGFILESKLFFYDHICSTSEYYRDLRSLNNFKTLAQDFMTIYEPPSFSDIAIKIGNETLRVHKSILCAHSPVFMKMMTHDFVESKNSTINITDCEVDIFKYMLKYLYSGEIEDKSWTTLRDLYILADKYDIGALKQKCTIEISECHLTLDKVSEILKIAYEYSDKNLKHKSTNFAAENFQQLLSNAEWTALVALHPLIGYEVSYSAHINISS